MNTTEKDVLVVEPEAEVLAESNDIENDEKHVEFSVFDDFDFEDAIMDAFYHRRT
ncbi:hypothetical protein [Levilactobacillus brevis]|uniref:hypothetical protein n=1 Tax=Levilactobacillus brevis TaxID=1580 RepID=UPI00339BD0AE